LTRYGLALTQFSIRVLAPIHTSIHTSALRKNFFKERDPTPYPQNSFAARKPIKPSANISKRTKSSARRIGLLRKG
jgi:hypothetical protein